VFARRAQTASFSVTGARGGGCGTSSREKGIIGMKRTLMTGSLEQRTISEKGDPLSRPEEVHKTFSSSTYWSAVCLNGAKDPKVNSRDIGHSLSLFPNANGEMKEEKKKKHGNTGLKKKPGILSVEKL